MTTQEPLIEQPNQYIRDKAFRAHLEAVLGRKTANGPEIPTNFNQTPVEKEPEPASIDRGDVIKCGLPASSRPSEGENRTDPLRCREQLLKNDPELKVITLNNMKRLPLEHIQWMIMAIKDNTVLEKLNLANLNLHDFQLEPLLEVIENNRTLKAINIETNCLSGNFLARLFQAALKQQTLIEVKAVNQSTVCSNENELAIMDAVQKNYALTKVSVDLRLPDPRYKIEHATLRNAKRKRQGLPIPEKVPEEEKNPAQPQVVVLNGSGSNRSDVKEYVVMAKSTTHAFSEAEAAQLAANDRSNPVKCALPAARPKEDENETDPNECTEKLLKNDPELKVITLNNLKRLPVPTIQRLILAIKENTVLERLNLANLSLNDANLEPLLEVVEHNRTLKGINIETNFLSGQFLARLFQAAAQQQTLEEVKAVNQNAAWSTESETAMTEAIEANEGLLKVSVQTRRPENRNKIEKATIRNREIVRIRRMHEALIEKRAWLQ